MKVLALFLLISVVAAQGCKPACCDILVKADDDSTVGLNCTPGGDDCPFSGQLTACCEGINGLTKIGVNCKRA
ncbi:hypothetical protein GQ42DRAFT_1053 [Ramicandelaber brevisporus]|nr:hypothetical protein GQ42DRAFT_1053 [Ramicandelaber brevisporus]